MKQINKQKFITKVLNVIIAFVLATVFSTTPETINQAKAATYINLGALNVSLLDNEGDNWLKTEIKPEQQITKQIRVANFSPEKKDLTIYATDAETNHQGTFIAKNQNQPSEDLKNWITLPAEQISLNPGESKILSLNIKAPTNAGIGQHQGAIIFKENQTKNQINLEQGIRLYLTVPGTAINSEKIENIAYAQGINSYVTNFTIKNTGNSNIKEKYTLTLENIITKEQTKQEKEVFLTPNQTKQVILEVEKPLFGIYQPKLTKTTTTESKEENLPIELEIPFIATLILTAGFLYQAFRKTDLTKIKHYIKQKNFKNTVAYLTAFALVTSLTIYYTNNQQNLRAQLITNTQPAIYNLTIRWGNFRKEFLPKTLKTSWKGVISFSNAQVSLKEKLNTESNDSFEVSNDQTAINFINQTGPDNDGIILKVSPITDITPTLIYNDLATGNTTEIRLDSIVNTPYIINKNLSSVYFNATKEYIKLPFTVELSATPEIAATPELQATPEINTTDDNTTHTINNPEIQNLFAQDLPATPEALANYILNSDYVDQINTQRKTAQVETDTALIKALTATPEVLAEVAATPELNYLFIPTENINFPAQEFSFKESKTSQQNLGTLIFVKNKGEKWNTYIGTTNFKSLSGNSEIPASALTIIPGEAKQLTPEQSAQITVGTPRTFNGTEDKSMLVNVDSTTNDKQIFILNPTLQIRIPPGTPPGRYKGTLTITTL